MNDYVYEMEKNKALYYAKEVKQKQELYELRHKYDKPKEKLSFSKMAFIFMIANCVVIEAYALFTMFFFQDLSSLPTLIAAVVGECISFISYEFKSMKENSAHGIVYESAMKKLEYELENTTDDAVG